MSYCIPSSSEIKSVGIPRLDASQERAINFKLRQEPGYCGHKAKSEWLSFIAMAMPPTIIADAEIWPVESTSMSASQLNGSGEQAVYHRHSTYYFDYDPMATLLVEDKLCRIHRYYLTQGSEVFRAMFASPPEEGKDPDGIHDDQPIDLPGVTIREFEALMSYLYLPPHARSRYNDIQQNVDIYLDLLSISHRFLFDDIFQYALRQLESIKDQVPVETRLLIGDTYGLKNWLSSAYETLLDRQKAITTDECKAMGFERVVAFLRAREFRYRERLQIAERNLERTREGHSSLDPSTPETSNQEILKMFLL